MFKMRRISNDDKINKKNLAKIPEREIYDCGYEDNFGHLSQLAFAFF